MPKSGSSLLPMKQKAKAAPPELERERQMRTMQKRNREKLEAAVHALQQRELKAKYDKMPSDKDQAQGGEEAIEGMSSMEYDEDEIGGREARLKKFDQWLNTGKGEELKPQCKTDGARSNLCAFGPPVMLSPPDVVVTISNTSSISSSSSSERGVLKKPLVQPEMPRPVTTRSSLATAPSTQGCTLKAPSLVIAHLSSAAAPCKKVEVNRPTAAPVEIVESNGGNRIWTDTRRSKKKIARTDDCKDRREEHRGQVEWEKANCKCKSPPWQGHDKSCPYLPGRHQASFMITPEGINLTDGDSDHPVPASVDSDSELNILNAVVLTDEEFEEQSALLAMAYQQAMADLENRLQRPPVSPRERRSRERERSHSASRSQRSNRSHSSRATPVSPTVPAASRATEPPPSLSSSDAQSFVHVDAPQASAPPLDYSTKAGVTDDAVCVSLRRWRGQGAAAAYSQLMIVDGSDHRTQQGFQQRRDRVMQECSSKCIQDITSHINP